MRVLVGLKRSAVRRHGQWPLQFSGWALDYPSAQGVFTPYNRFSEKLFSSHFKGKKLGPDNKQFLYFRRGNTGFPLRYGFQPHIFLPTLLSHGDAQN
jgi:hypothetical protein